MKTLLYLALVAMVWAVDPVTVRPPTAKPNDMSGTGLTSSYCVSKGKECKGADLKPAKFAPIPSQCLSRCTRMPNCLSVFIDGARDCHLRGKRCLNGALKMKTGATYYRLKVGETCPPNTVPYVENNKKYSNSFCAAAGGGKACPGHNIYKQPRNIKPFMKCLEKCAKIKSCGMIDYHENTRRPCEILVYQCSESELKDSPGTINYLRLEEGVSVCPAGFEPVVPTEPPTTMAPTSPPDLNPNCEEVSRADIVFVIDASGSVEQDGFNREVQFVSEIVRQLNNIRADGQGIRVAAQTYSWTFKWGLMLSQIMNRDGYRAAISAMTWTAGGTYTFSALSAARSHLIANGRPGVPHIMVVLTDGVSANEGATIGAANACRAAGIHLISVGIGSNLRMSELDAMADRPLDKFKFIVNDFRILETIAAEVKKAMFCKPSP